jgi:hypothetical protein
MKRTLKDGNRPENGSSNLEGQETLKTFIVTQQAHIRSDK